MVFMKMTTNLVSIITENGGHFLWNRVVGMNKNELFMHNLNLAVNNASNISCVVITVTDTSSKDLHQW